MELLPLAPKISTPLTAATIKRLPARFCERRKYDFNGCRLLTNSREGYATILTLNSSNFVAMDVATDDWCPMDVSGFEKFSEDGPFEFLCLNAKLFLFGRSEENTNEIIIQIFDFTQRKWTKINNFNTSASAAFIVAFADVDEEKIYFYVVCVNNQLIEGVVDARRDRVKILKRSIIKNVFPDSSDHENFHPQEKTAFVDYRKSRIFRLILTEGAYDFLHVLNLKSVEKEWTTLKIAKNDVRPEIIAENNSQSRHFFRRSIFSVRNQTFTCFLAKENSTTVCSFIYAEKENVELQWTETGILENIHVNFATMDDFFGVIYLLASHQQNVDDSHNFGGSKHQSLIRAFLGVPCLKFLASTAIINAVDPKTKIIQRRHLVVQLRPLPADFLKVLWHRIKLDRGVLKYLTKGAERYGEFAKDDDPPIRFFTKFKMRIR